MVRVDDEEAQNNPADIKKGHRIFQRDFMHFTIEKDRKKLYTHKCESR